MQADMQNRQVNFIEMGAQGIIVTEPTIMPIPFDAILQMAAQITMHDIAQRQGAAKHGIVRPGVQ